VAAISALLPIRLWSDLAHAPIGAQPVRPQGVVQAGVVAGEIGALEAVIVAAFDAAGAHAAIGHAGVALAATPTGSLCQIRQKLAERIELGCPWLERRKDSDESLKAL
jgi:hypothetical protein